MKRVTMFVVVVATVLSTLVAKAQDFALHVVVDDRFNVEITEPVDARMPDDLLPLGFFTVENKTPPTAPQLFVISVYYGDAIWDSIDEDNLFCLHLDPYTNTWEKLEPFEQFFDEKYYSCASVTTGQFAAAGASKDMEIVYMPIGYLPIVMTPIVISPEVDY